MSKQVLSQTLSLLLLLCGATLLQGCRSIQVKPTNPLPTESGDARARVSVEKRNSHYVVSIIQGSPEDTGRQYGLALKSIPEWSKKWDEYLSECIGAYISQWKKSESETMAVFVKRAQDLMSSLNTQDRQEVLAFIEAAATSKKTKNNDGLLSKDEIMIIQFLPEVVRAAACSAISAFGPMAHNGGNLVGRTLEWYAGKNGAINHLNAIVIHKQSPGTASKNMTPEASLSVGYLGYLPVLTAINSVGTFVALFDCKYGVSSYVTKGKRSFTFDLREAIRNFSSKENICDFLMQPKQPNPYAFNGIVADDKGTVAIENAHPEGRYKAAIRTSNSALLPGVLWEFKHALAMVNSNVLENHFNNHNSNESTKKLNHLRWESFRANLAHANLDGRITLDEIQEIITHRKKADLPSPGDIYGLTTQYMTLWDASAKSFKVWFRQPGDKVKPHIPIFEEVPLPW